MLSIAKSLIDWWNEQDVLYCHFKSNEHLLAGLNGDTDLDILMDPMHRKQGIAGLHKVGYKQFRSQMGAQYPQVEDWIGMDYETGRLSHIHLHYHLITGQKYIKE